MNKKNTYHTSPFLGEKKSMERHSCQPKDRIYLEISKDLTHTRPNK